MVAFWHPQGCDPAGQAAPAPVRLWRAHAAGIRARRPAGAGQVTRDGAVRPRGGGGGAGACRYCVPAQVGEPAPAVAVYLHRWAAPAVAVYLQRWAAAPQGTCSWLTSRSPPLECRLEVDALVEGTTAEALEGLQLVAWLHPPGTAAGNAWGEPVCQAEADLTPSWVARDTSGQASSSAAGVGAVAKVCPWRRLGGEWVPRGSVTSQRGIPSVSPRGPAHNPSHCVFRSCLST